MKTRETWLDGLKGFAILLVILGHVLSGYLDAEAFPDAYYDIYALRSWIYSFHMPLFFLISGFTFTLAYYPGGVLRRRGYFRQLFNLFWLYSLFALLQWGIKQVVPELVNAPYDLTDLKRMYIEPLGNFWYLYVLFIFYVLAALLRLPKWPPLWLLLFGGIAIFSADIHLNWTDLTLYRILYHLPFFILGSVLCQNRSLLQSKKLLGIAAMFLSAASVFYFFLYARDWYSNWKLLIALSACFVNVVLFSHFDWLSAFPLFQLCGTCCLEMYLLHTFFTGGLRSVLLLLGITTPALSITLNFLLSTGLSLLLSMTARRFRIFDLVFRPAKFFSTKNG